MKPYIVISYLVAAILLLLGGLVYIVYRPLSLKMFQWFHLSESTPWLFNLRSVAPHDLPDWVIYALPDGLWACSYVILIGAIWYFSLPQCLPAALLIPAIGIISELLQKVEFLPGVYDWTDLTAYASGASVGMIYIFIINKIKTKQCQIQ